jgi:hypothetical protein
MSSFPPQIEVRAKSELGALASRFDSNSRSLREFDEALRTVRRQRKMKRTPETERTLEGIKKVVFPVAQSIENKLPESTDINENRVIDIVRKRHSHDWPSFRSGILNLDRAIRNPGDLDMSDEDIEILNELANALDAECNSIFQKMGEGR